MSTDPETTRIVRSWLTTDEHESATSVVEVALAEIATTPQRSSTRWPARRTPTMNKILGFGLAAAAVVAVVFIGSQVIGSNPNGLGADPTPIATPEPTQEPTPAQSEWAGLPQGAFLITGADGAVDGGPAEITVDIASPGWDSLAEYDAIGKNDDGLDSPETVGVVFAAWSWPVGTGFNVYGDPCQWSTTIPESPATTPEEIAAALAAQASRDATAPVDITVGGYTGKAITLHVPMSYEVPGATREEEFADCDQSTFATFGLEGNDTEAVWNSQGPGQVEELSILDVDGSIVILVAIYGPAAPAGLVEEMRAFVLSATFETP